MRARIGLLGLLLVCVVLAARPAGAAEDATCPGPLTSSYKLTGDLTCSLVVGGPNVTVDLGGFTLFGGIFADFEQDTSGMVVRNGTIDGNEAPLLIVNHSVRNTIDRVELRRSSGFAVQLGAFSVITRSAFVDNAVGVDLFWGANTEVVDSTFSGNNFGIVNGSDVGTVIEHNAFMNNDVGLQVWDEDLVGSSDVQVRTNMFHDNRVGLKVIAVLEVNRLQVTGNRFVDNAEAGISVELRCDEFTQPCGLAESLIADNRLSKNGHGGSAVLNDGIAVTGFREALANITLANNRAERNADLGIDATGVTDGGGNRARGNGNPLQCVGVACV